MSMVRGRTAWLSGLILLAVVLVCQLPARAEWYVTNVYYSTSGDGHLDQYVYHGDILVAHRERTRTGSFAWVTLTVYCKVDGEGNPIHVEQSLSGNLNLLAGVTVGGSGPPFPKPTLWGQTSHMNATYSLDLLEQETVVGDYVMDAKTHIGVPNPGQPTIHYWDSIASSGVELHYFENGSRNPQETTWQARPVRPPPWYTAAFLHAEVSVDMDGGGGGTVVANAQARRTSWGVGYYED